MSKMTSSVGDIIDARCTKCKKVTNHVIVAMVESKPANVQCNTCGGTHRYRSPEPVRTAAKRASDAALVKQEEWANLRAAMNNLVAKDYSMDMDYRIGSVVNHPNFGFGLVQRHVGNRKIEILFEDGKKTMRCK